MAVIRSLLAAAAVGAVSAQAPRVSPRYGTKWGVQYLADGVKLVNVTVGDERLAYVLTPRGAAPPPTHELTALLPTGTEDPRVIEIPLLKAALLSTTQIQFAEVRRLPVFFRWGQVSPPR